MTRLSGKWVLVALAATVLVGCSRGSSDNEVSLPESNATDPAEQLSQKNGELAAAITSLSPREHPERYLTLTANWHIASGTQMIANLTIVNNNEFAVKDIAIKCRVAAPSGINIGSAEKTVEAIVPPRQTKVFANIDFGYVSDLAKSAACAIRNASVAD